MLKGHWLGMVAGLMVIVFPLTGCGLVALPTPTAIVPSTSTPSVSLGEEAYIEKMDAIFADCNPQVSSLVALWSKIVDDPLWETGHVWGAHWQWEMSKAMIGVKICWERMRQIDPPALFDDFHRALLDEAWHIGRAVNLLDGAIDKAFSAKIDESVVEMIEESVVEIELATECKKRALAELEAIR